MYALERRVLLRAGHCLRHCWTRYVVCANRSLLERVRAGQSKPGDWRVVPSAEKTGRIDFSMDMGRPAA